MRETFARPDGEPEPVLQFEEGNGTMFEFLSDDAFGLQPETITVEIE